jgi:hypothetical protein
LSNADVACVRRLALPVCLAVVLSVVATLHADKLPARLSDRDYWRLVATLSEPDGSFRSDNLVSNEAWMQHVIPDLVRAAKPGQVYLGVGPEQNFTYISAVKPAMAFIVDVRRGNLHLHLMYKALFELSTDRNEFVSRLFSRPEAAALDASSSPAEIFAAYGRVEPSETLYDVNLAAIRRHLLRRHGFELSQVDLDGIEYVYRAFFRFGPDLRYASTSGFGGGVQPSYAALMTATDRLGRSRGYLATEEAFRVLKDLHSRNLIVPVVGNFGGPKTIRAVADYVWQRQATVSAFYVSNVEQYLRQGGLWQAFCANLTMLPIDPSSTFIRAVTARRAKPGTGLVPELSVMGSRIADCH